MIVEDLAKLFERDLDRLQKELESYPSEESLWLKVEGINNTAGNLFIHLCGNLQHFIGATLAQNGYVRNRDFEFQGRLPFEQIKKEIEITKEVITQYFGKVKTSALDELYPLEVFGYPMTTSYFLIHLQGHMNYHTGQINYHRRILSEG